ncbi:hypothetical protein CEXT_225701 [Caerostris extrusa]|uniref:Uncharacterized protein n=1 Tax=Caerostris extrusa TaxID=172846 RepID=A0AAV4Y9Y4_CAEEX|nr:hypothetical protein CEXT_225701 [Caerostris extrusa]
MSFIGRCYSIEEFWNDNGNVHHIILMLQSGRAKIHLFMMLFSWKLDSWRREKKCSSYHFDVQPGRAGRRCHFVIPLKNSRKQWGRRQQKCSSCHFDVTIRKEQGENVVCEFP